MRHTLRHNLSGLLFVALIIVLQPCLASSSEASTVTSANVSATTVTPGSSVTLTASVQSSIAAANMLIDLEIYNAAGAKVAQQFYTGQNFSAGQTISEKWNYAVPSNASSGIYTLKIGLFTANWASLTFWNNGATTFTIASAAACGTHASGSTYTLTTGTTTGSAAATVAQCPYGGTQPTTVTTTQSYSCSNGVQTAQGSPVSTTANTGTPSCNAPAACGTHASGSTYTLTTGTTTGSAAATAAQCPYGGTQPTTVTTTQSYSCSNGVQTAQGSPVSTTANTGTPSCNAPAACGTHASGSTYTLTTGTTTGSAAATVAQCPYGGTQPTTVTTTQSYSCSNGVQTAQGSPVSTTANTGTPSCNAPAACGTHASGSTYTLTTGTTTGSAAATAAQCPYGGTQPTTVTTTQSYSCSNGVQTAQGSPVSTTANTGTPSCNAAPKASTNPPSITGAFGVQVDGNQFTSTKDGKVLQLLGVSISGFEQGASALNAASNGYNNAADAGFSEMASWNINLVRIPLNEDTWLGINNCNLYGGSTAALQANVKQAVANANAAGLYVILDLHWSAPQSFGCPAGQGAMPDADHTAAFWTSVAETFKGNPAVMFEIFNEPFGTNDYNNWVIPVDFPAPIGQSATDLSILLNGGTYYNGYMYQCNVAVCNLVNGQEYVAPGAFQTAGMQSLVNAIRATGATNVIISNAMGWAGEIQTWLGAQPNDPLHQLAAGWHEDGGWLSTAANADTILNNGYPIIITEAYNNGAAATGYVDYNGVNLFDWATSNKVGYSYWGWNDWQGGTLVDTQKYAPNALGASLKSSYCSQPAVNGLAQCH